MSKYACRYHVAMAFHIHLIKIYYVINHTHELYVSVDHRFFLNSSYSLLMQPRQFLFSNGTQSYHSLIINSVQLPLIYPLPPISLPDIHIMRCSKSSCPPLYNTASNTRLELRLWTGMHKRLVSPVHTVGGSLAFYTYVATHTISFTA